VDKRSGRKKLRRRFRLATLPAALSFATRAGSTNEKAPAGPRQPPTVGALAAWLAEYIHSIQLTRRRHVPRPEPGRLTRAELYQEARRLGIPGRSKMDRQELLEAIQREQGGSSSPRILDRYRAGVTAVAGLAAAASSHRPWAGRRLTLFAGSGRLASMLRTPRPARVLILSLAMLATGGLGLMVAYAVSPADDVLAPVLVTNGQTVRLVTVTGPGGTKTLAVTRTKRGKTRLVPVRVLRTVTGPGGTRTTAVQVAGPAITERRVVTQLQQTTKTQVVTQVEPVTVVMTNVVTQSDTVVVTETVVVEVTTTVPSPPPPPAP
jgi:Rho termination factor-like protein